MIDFASVEALTFDCYGTLIDWESGILNALAALLEPASAKPDNETLLEQYGRFEPAAEDGPFRPYRDVLQDVARMFGDAYSIEVDSTAASAFAASVGDWPPFSDSVDALQALAGRYRLAIVSNVDDDLFAGSAARLGVTFDEVVTAQQVGTYKPSRGHFDEVLRRLDLPREKVLHCAQSLYHDIAPGGELGFRCVWVNRRAGRSGAGATPPAEAAPDLEVPDLASLARVAGV
ncbi:MAG: haloacid dehalogenase type II [Longimicrobiales bacterium]|nr:haloacid dehalogenase type II [Longimicrobiales bacterium]